MNEGKAMSEAGLNKGVRETLDEVQARHKKELKALEGSGRRLVKQANKNKAKVAEAESKFAQMLQEAKERHERELDAAAASASTAREGAALEAKAGETEEAVQGMESMSIEDGEKEKRDQKRAKAQRKRDKQRAKEVEREERIDREKREGGADPRITEMEAIGGQITPRANLTPDGCLAACGCLSTGALAGRSSCVFAAAPTTGGLRVSEIKADGHCLYRAVAEQLRLTGRRPDLTEESYSLMRQAAARELRSSSGSYLPFLEGVAGEEDFNIYCEKVERSAEWGGQVELQALCSALEVPIEVFSATSPPLLLGENYEGTPLRITYHDHYYALGAHYNSIVSC